MVEDNGSVDPSRRTVGERGRTVEVVGGRENAVGRSLDWVPHRGAL